MATSIISKEYPDMELSVSDDLNDIIKTGFYSFVTTGSTYPAHSPAQRNFVLWTISANHSVNNARAAQLAIAGNGTVYYRYKFGENWSNWAYIDGTPIT